MALRLHIHSIVYSDHRLFRVRLNFNKPRISFGGYEKLNTSLFDEKDFQDHLVLPRMRELTLRLQLDYLLLSIVSGCPPIGWLLAGLSILNLSIESVPRCSGEIEWQKFETFHIVHINSSGLLTITHSVHSCLGALTSQVNDESAPTWHYLPRYNKFARVFRLCRLSLKLRP